jgi:hypothetical protein
MIVILACICIDFKVLDMREILFKSAVSPPAAYWASGIGAQAVSTGVHTASSSPTDLSTTGGWFGSLLQTAVTAGTGGAATSWLHAYLDTQYKETQREEAGKQLESSSVRREVWQIEEFRKNF